MTGFSESRVRLITERFCLKKRNGYQEMGLLMTAQFEPKS